MPIITVKGKTNRTFTFPPLKVDEFLPVIRFDNPSKYVVENEELTLSGEEVTLSKHLDKDKQTFKILELTTNKKTIKLPFKVNKGVSFFSVFEKDDDGYVEPKLSIENDNYKITSALKNLKKYGSDLEVELKLNGTETTEFYLDFYANDNEDTFKGDYINVHCGRIKIIHSLPNAWEFSKEKIDEVIAYAKENNAKYEGPGDGNRYHHCTDTHKHIVYKLLNTPEHLNLGKDQDHSFFANRLTPNDFKKAGESTTDGVRQLLINTTYAEPSKTFTVIDTNGDEVLTSNGTPGNTNNELKQFKESPIAYMKAKCLDNGYYVFIGAYNDDYHSFTIIVHKEEETFNFQFVDQLVGVVNYAENSLETSKLLINVDDYANNFPMKLELYQLRNKKK